MNLFIAIIGFLIIAAGAAIMVLSALFAARRNEADAREWRRSCNDGTPAPRYKGAKWPIALIIAGAAAMILSQAFAIVPTGYTGVRTTFGLIDQESCMPGFNGLVPFVQKISLVNNKQQDIRLEERIWSETKEQVVVYMEGTVVTYRIVPESSAWIYANVENWIQELVDADVTGSACKSATRSLGADEVTDRGTVEPLAKQSLQAAVDAKYGPDRVEILNVVFNNMDFEDSYNAAIAEKSNAMQVQQKQAITNQTEIDKAIAEAEAARQRAQGEADAELIRAQAKADAAKKIAEAVTETTQLQDAIEKWDGQLPLYVAGGEGTFGIMGAIDIDPGDNTKGGT